jgi:hypothetical protein
MAVFVVSFLIFTAAALLLLLGQRARGGQLPVGCTPESGDCCKARGFGKCIEPSGGSYGSLRKEGVRQWPAPSERS